MTWLDELFHALGLGDAINLVGLSYGVWLAAQYALRFPMRIRKMVLLAPGGVLPPSIEFMLRGSLVLTGNRRLARTVVNWLFEDLARKDPARVEASLDRMMMGLQCLAMRRPPGASVLRDEELRSLRMPTLVLVGDHEKIYSPVKAIARLKSVAPQIQVEIVPGAGYDLTIAQGGTGEPKNPELPRRLEKLLHFGFA
jgi:pimeloyl-ACP methyl ester carboxylesterase